MNELPDVIPFGEEPWKDEAPDTLPGDFNFDQSQAALSQSERILETTRQAEMARQQADALSSPMGIAKETGKGVLNTLLGAPFRAIGSAFQGVQDISRGEISTAPIAKDFLGQPVQSFQGGLKSGESPLSVGLDVASLLPVGKAVSTVKPLAKAASPLLKPLTSYMAKRAEKKVVDTALKAATPKTADLSSKEYEQLLRQKRITPSSAFKPSSYVMSESEKRAASKYKDLLQDKDPVKNSINVMEKISQEDEAVGTFLRQNNGIFNTGELKNSIAEKLKDVTDVAIPESRVNKLKKDITDNFLKSLQKNDMESLWQARKEFDQQIESAFSGSPSLQKEVKKKFRNAVQEFIAERTPDDVYKSKMKDMSDLFDIEETLAMKAAKEKGRAAWMQWVKDNPAKAKIIGYGATAVGGAALWDLAQ